MDYDPLIHPLELPVQRLTLHCLPAAPLQLRPRPGSTPGTLFYGAFGVALWDCVCARRRRGLAACNQGPEGVQPHCLEPQSCTLPWLFKPYSAVQHRTMTRPVLLRAPELETGQPVTAFTLQLTLWGRQAIAARQAVLDTIASLGATGLDVAGMRLPFTLAEAHAGPVQTLAERAAALAGQPWQRLLLQFVTPFLHRESVQLDAERRIRLFMAGGLLPLDAILGNVAYELAAWDMEDRESGETLDRENRHHLARQSREAARQAAQELYLSRCELHPVDVGERFSRSSGGAYPLQGFQGEVELAGPVAVALPWLLALILGGGGQKRAMGFGVVCGWLGLDGCGE